MNPSSRDSRRSLLQARWPALAVVSGLALAACSGAVGHGNAPSYLVITAPGGTTQVPTLRMYECLTSAVNASLYFQDGSSGNFTNRLTWSSSNPGAVVVSNGDIPVPDGSGFYANGVLVPTGAGNAIITANYFGIVAQLAVSVGTPKSVALKTIVQGDYLPLSEFNTTKVATDSSGLSMGLGTSMELAVTAELDGVETDVTKFATFGFQSPAGSIAAFAPGSGTLNAVGNGGPVVPVASFGPCTITTMDNPSNIYKLFVSPVQSIALQTEFPNNPQLFVNNTERIDVIASLANGDQQDVSSESTLTSSDTSVATFGGASGVNSILYAVSVGPAILTGTFSAGGSLLTAASLETSVRNLPLQAITTCWSPVLRTQFQGCPASQANPTVQAGTLTPVQFHAIGTYGVDANNNLITQEVTRQTTWTPSDLSLASISNTGQTAGQAFGLAQGSVNITAANAVAANVPQAYNQLVVQPPPPPSP
ncbi:MAG: hypothetical protein P4L83_19510 [Nevskia sp.]|nr:hypothetical protein [Nevskia sp.]